MNSDITLLTLLIVLFCATVLAVAAVGLWLTSGSRTLRRRLEEAAQPEAEHSEDNIQQGAFNVHWEKDGKTPSLPGEDWQSSRLKQRLVRSGLRARSSMNVLMISKVALAVVVPMMLVLPAWVLGWFQGQMALAVLWMVVTALAGFLIPDMYLSYRATERRREISEIFPDVLDLLVVCVEAGLGLDAAIQRVGKEISRSSHAMSDELILVTLEMRAGKARHEALMGLAERSGVKDIQSLVSILIQAENFGTSVGEALREHASEMRNIRIQRAREKAAKLPVKLTFPILLFIFPSLFLVILGPALAKIYIGLGGALG